MSFLLAKQRMLYVFGDSGKLIQVSLRNQDRNVPAFEASATIPVGVVVEWADPMAPRPGGEPTSPVLKNRPFPCPGDEKNLLEISVALKP